MKSLLKYAAAFSVAAILCASGASVYGARADETASLADAQPDETAPLTDTQPDAADALTVSTFAGTGSHGYTDGKPAAFHLPGALTGDGRSIYVADTYNNLIREISARGTVKTVSGEVLSVDGYRFPKGFYKDESLSGSLFNRPAGIAAHNNKIYIADSANHVIRLANSRNVTTYAGNGQGYQDGKSYEAQFDTPSGIALDGAGNAYVADTLNHVIRKIDTGGVVTTVAGVPGEPGLQDTSILNAKFNCPMGIAVSEDGKTVYVADTGNHVIRKISERRVTTLAGMTELTDGDGEPLGDFADGANGEAMFNLPIGIVIYGDKLIVADSGNHRVRLVTETEVTTLAGTGEPGAADGAAPEASFNLPSGLYLEDKTLYIADTANNMIRMIELGE